MKKFFIALLLGMLTMTASGCELLRQSDEQAHNDAKFEIYLLPVDADRDEKVENLSCAGKEGPLLSNQDIQKYVLETHEMHLSQSAIERLTPMELAGKPFVVCVNQEPIYSGEFMALFMSRSSDRVVILWPPMDIDQPVMKIQLGYPGPDFYTGEDPRSDARIINALEQAGLIEKDAEK